MPLAGVEVSIRSARRTGMANLIPEIFSNQRAGYASDQTLGVIGENMGLGKNGILQQHPRNYRIVSATMRATAVEAIVGAVYLDGQADMAVVERVLGVMGIGE